MPWIQVPGGEKYALIAFDADGAERSDDPVGRMSQLVLDAVAGDSVTDVFVMSHGWKGDLPTAKASYDAWVAAMLACDAARAIARQRPGYHPLIIGLHWPSQPWGDEEFASVGSFAASGPGGRPGLAAAERVEASVQAYAQRVSRTPAALAALRTILTEAFHNPSPETLPADVRSAFLVLEREAGVGSDGVAASPGRDRALLDPEARYQIELEDTDISFGLSDMGGSILSLLRQTSFWTMKNRARIIGEGEGHTFVNSLLRARAGIRVHLMGHSFGCIVVSACVAGPVGGLGLSAAVHSLVLVQGALSLWSYCSAIPSQRHLAGYFRPIMAGARVAGPIVTTRSVFDKAVGDWYPRGAGVARQIAFAAPTSLPEYGGAGSFGLQGPGIDIVELRVQPATATYDFQSGRVYNLECSSVIRADEGISGAHSDVAHPEIAHAVWSAANT
jgi:hypothetical protein